VLALQHSSPYCLLFFFVFFFLFGSGSALRSAKLGARCAQDLLETQVNPAVFEIAGHMIMKRKEDYDFMTEARAEELLAAVSLGPEAFGEVKALCLEAAGAEARCGARLLPRR